MRPSKTREHNKNYYVSIRVNQLRFKVFLPTHRIVLFAEEVRGPGNKVAC